MWLPLHFTILLVFYCTASEGAKLDSSIFSPAINRHQRFIVLILDALGLGNRLRSMADWHQIALLTNRSLLVSWKATHDCNAEFSDLFDDGPPHLHMLPVSWPTSSEGVLELMAAAEEAGLTSEFMPVELETFEEDRFGNSVNVLITSHNGQRVKKGINCQFNLNKKSEFYRALVPVQTVRNIVQEITETYFKNRMMIGVHMRMHDERFDWGVVPPLRSDADRGSTGTPEAAVFGNGATLEDFSRVMGNLQQRFTATGVVGSNILSQFYVASNSDSAKKQIMKLFPNSITISMTDGGSRDSPNSIIAALADWLLLSKAEIIIHTYGSSFALESSVVNLRPLVGLWDGNLLHYNSIYQPLCGSAQYMKLQASQIADIQPGEYVERFNGEVKEMKVTSVPLKYGPCDALADWAFNEPIYCAKRHQ